MNDYENEFKPKIEKANGLPNDWNWVMYQDGSGHLESPDNKSYFSYDKAPYANVGGIEYQECKGKGWDVYWDSFEEFKTFSEKIVLTKYFRIGD